MQKNTSKNRKLSPITQIIVPTALSFLLFLVVYLILSKENDKHRFVIAAYESKIKEIETTQGWVDEIVKLRKEFVDIDMFIEESFTSNERFLNLLDSSLVNFPKLAQFVELNLKEDVGYIKLVANEEKLVDDYCKKLTSEGLLCAYEMEKGNNYSLMIELGKELL